MDEGVAIIPQQFLLALVEPFGTLWFIYLLPIFFVVAKLCKNVPAWIVLFAAGVWLLVPMMGTWCMDCIGGHPLPGGDYYFGEGGFKVPWGDLVVVSALTATAVTWLVVVASRARLRRRSRAPSPTQRN